jgi:2-C-methyl-D-erythritol 4-phosphate cytidylyltransferase
VDVILIHDAARPLVTAMVIDRAIRAAADGECVIAATPVTDTIQQVNGHGAIVATPDRRTLWRAQTPQAFPRSIVAAAYRQAEADGFLATDDAAIITRYGGTVRVIEGDPGNMKITVPADVRIAEALLGK